MIFESTIQLYITGQSQLSGILNFSALWHDVQGTLDLMVLKTLEAMGPLPGHWISRRIKQISEDTLRLDQGTTYASLLRLLHKGWIKGEWAPRKQPQGQVLFPHQITPQAAADRGEELELNGSDFAPEPEDCEVTFRVEMWRDRFKFGPLARPWGFNLEMFFYYPVSSSLRR